MREEKKKMIKIYYYNREFSRDAGMGVEFLKENNLLPDTNEIEKTHTLMTASDYFDLPDNKINFEFNGTESLELLYSAYQGHNWSPTGEARLLIKALGLNHTSMSMGDIIKVDDVFYMVDTFGFTDITNYEFEIEYTPDELNRLALENNYLSKYESGNSGA